MARKNTTTKVTGDLQSRIVILEARVAALEKQARNVKKVIHRKREYTEEERVAIRTRLLAGQEAARKKREAEAKATKKVKADKQEKATLINESNHGTISQQGL